MKKSLFVIAILILFLFLAFNAKAGILDNLPGPEVMPDSPFYFLKVWYEKVITFLSFGDTKKAERYTELAKRRLHEAEKMAEKGKQELTEMLLEQYEKFLDKAFGKVEELKKQAEQEVKKKAKEKIDQAIEKVSESTLENQEILLKIYELVPDRAKDAIEKVIEITKKGYERAIEAVSGIKKEGLIQRAEEIKTRAKKLIEGWKKIFGE